MVDFCDLTKPNVRIGKSSERPTVPPDKQAVFVDTGTLGLGPVRFWTVDDAMTWVEFSGGEDIAPLLFAGW